MAVRQRGASWQADCQHDGVRYRETFATEKEARAWEHEARKALKKGLPVPGPQESVGAYSTMEKLVRVVENTRWTTDGSHQMRSCAQRFLDFVGPAVSPEAALTQANVDAWIAHETTTRNLSRATINRHLSAVSVLVKRAMAAGLVQRKLDLSWQKENEARLCWFSEDEDALIVQTLTLWGLPRWADFFVFLTDTGLRTWTEAARLPWGDITEHPHRMVTVWDTKNGDARGVPLTIRAHAAIGRQPRGSAGPFTDLGKDEGRRVFDRLRLHLPQLSDATWYTCRHTFASRLVQRGVDLYRVSKLMGHRSATMTQRYAKLAPANLIEAVSVLEQRAGAGVNPGGGVPSARAAVAELADALP